ncbi:MAG TPA: hypothetical protein VGA63_07680, partial [Geopsychrobacteraceae bacterium]
MRVAIEFFVLLNLFGDARLFAAIAAQAEPATVVTAPLTIMAVRAGVLFLSLAHGSIVRGYSKRS